MNADIRQGHVLDVLRTLPEASVQCVVTSPPYWGLRDYGTPPQVWGGDPDHDHEWGAVVKHRTSGGPQVPQSKWSGVDAVAAAQRDTRSDLCPCGAWRGSLGLEPTPWLYLEHMLAVFAEVWRVLKPDGTVWLNMGDCYATGAGAETCDDKRGYRGARLANGRGDQPAVLRQKSVGRGAHTAENSGKAAPRLEAMGPMTQPNRMPIPGLKPKDLVGMPWRLALALQDAGWWLRRDIIWSKPNPMPESAEDRPTTAHEYLFLLTKRAHYYYDGDAIKEPVTGGAHPRGNGVNPKARVPSGWETDGGHHHGAVGRYARRKDGQVSGRLGRGPGWRVKQNESFSAAVTGPVAERNSRSVWTIATAPFPEAHFATFPQALVTPCVLAGSRPGDVVLDPFAGAGTVAIVALRHGRKPLLIELSEKYVQMARRRVLGPLFAER